MKIICCGLLGLLAACEFPSRSERYACNTTSDCESGRTCEDGYCILGPGGGGGADSQTVDGPPIDMAPPDGNMLAAQCTAAGFTYNAAANGYYKNVTTGTSWTNAQAACKADVAGSSHLIVLSTTAEVTFMSPSCTDNAGCWVGLSDRITENQFTTVTSETADQRPWRSGQPDNGGGSEDCAQMKSNGQLDDDQCGNNHRYFCECDGKTSTP